jgi:hypothetical protein
MEKEVEILCPFCCYHSRDFGYLKKKKKKREQKKEKKKEIATCILLAK